MGNTQFFDKDNKSDRTSAAVLHDVEPLKNGKYSAGKTNHNTINTLSDEKTHNNNNQGVVLEQNGQKQGQQMIQINKNNQILNKNQQQQPVQVSDFEYDFSFNDEMNNSCADRINKLKSQVYKQANIMQKYNNSSNYFPSNGSRGRVSNDRRKESYKKGIFNEKNNQQSYEKSTNIDSLLYSPAKQQQYLKNSPQIPCKNSTYLQEHVENSESLLENEEFPQQKKERSGSISSQQVIPCEFCDQNIQVEQIQNHQRGCSQLQNNQNHNNNRNSDSESEERKQNNDNPNDNSIIECDICQKKINFNDYVDHIKDCDQVLICNKCNKQIPSRQFNSHLAVCNTNPWEIINQSQQSLMKMCDYCKMFIAYDTEEDFISHLNQHQKKKKYCHNCKKNIRYKYEFQYKQHREGLCIKPEIKENQQVLERILLLTSEEALRYNGKNDKGAIQEYWDMLDRYIFEEEHGLNQENIEKIYSFVLNSKTKKKAKKVSKSDVNYRYQQYIIDTDWKQQSCYVCLDQYDDNSLISLLPCKHSFHKMCLQEWLRRDGVCAVCRKDVIKMVLDFQVVKKK